MWNLDNYFTDNAQHIQQFCGRQRREKALLVVIVDEISLPRATEKK